MYILANETQVQITNYVVNRYDNQRGLVLSINTTKDNISLSDFDIFCTEIMTNESDILVYNDSNELEQTLRGFYHNCHISLDNNTNLMTADITNESENTYQIGILQDRNAILESAVVQYENDLTDTQLALVEQYKANITLEENIKTLEAQIAELQTAITQTSEEE